jgi:hypothetical protein
MGKKHKGGKMQLAWGYGTLVLNYCNKVARENEWRLRNLGYTKEDLLQELYIVYHTCKLKYDKLSDAEFFNRFRKAVTNRINSLTYLDRRERILKETYHVDNTYESEPEIFLKLSLERAPMRIKKLVINAIREKYSDKNIKIMKKYLER